MSYETFLEHFSMFSRKTPAGFLILKISRNFCNNRNGASFVSQNNRYRRNVFQKND